MKGMPITKQARAKLSLKFMPSESFPLHVQRKIPEFYVLTFAMYARYDSLVLVESLSSLKIATP
jgi:hypothetical protein